MSRSSKKAMALPGGFGDAPLDDDRRGHVAQRLAGGVAHDASKRHDPGGGTAARGPRFRHLNLEGEVIAGAERRQPFQFADAGRPERSGVADVEVEHHPHHDRAEMPARAGKPLEHRSLRRLLVEMHGLRIELGGKRQHLLARDMARPEAAEATGRKILEIERHAGRFGLREPDCGRSLRQSQPARRAWRLAPCPEPGSALALWYFPDARWTISIR